MKYLILTLALLLSKCGSNTLEKGNSEQKRANKNLEIDKMNEIFNLLETEELEKFNSMIDKLNKDDLNLILENRTLLMRAVEKGNENIVNLLIQKGADVNISNSKNETALYFAFKSNNKSMQKILLDNKAYFFDIVEFALDLDNEAAERIKQNYNEANSKNLELASELLSDNDNIEKVEDLLKKGATINIKNFNSSNILAFDLLEEDDDKVKNFLSKIGTVLKYGFDLDIFYVTQNFGYKITFFNSMIDKLFRLDDEELFIKICDILSANEDNLSKYFYEIIEKDPLKFNSRPLHNAFNSKVLNLDVKIDDETIIENLLYKYERYNIYREILIELFKRDNVKINLKGSSKDDIPILFLIGEKNDFDLLKSFLDRDPTIINLRDKKGKTLLIHLHLYRTETISLITELLDSKYDIDLEIKDDSNDSFYDRLFGSYLSNKFVNEILDIITKLDKQKKLDINFKSGEPNRSVLQKLTNLRLIKSSDEEDLRENEIKIRDKILNLIKENDIEKDNLNRVIYEYLKYEKEFDSVFEALLEKQNFDLNYMFTEKDYNSEEYQESLLEKFIDAIDRVKDENKKDYLTKILSDLLSKNRLSKNNLNRSLIKVLSSYDFNINSAKILFKQDGVDLNYNDIQKSYDYQDYKINLLEKLVSTIRKIKDEKIREDLIQILNDLLSKNDLSRETINNALYSLFNGFSLIYSEENKILLSLIKILSNQKEIDLNYIYVEKGYNSQELQISLLEKFNKFIYSIDDDTIKVELIEILNALLIKKGPSKDNLNRSLVTLIVDFIQLSYFKKNVLNVSLIKILLKQKNIDLNYNKGKNPLIYLSYFISKLENKLKLEDEDLIKDIIKTLIDLIKKSNIEKEFLNTSILFAIDAEELDLIKAIVEKGADLKGKFKHFEDEEATTALEYSLSHSSPKEIVDYLREKSKNYQF